MEKRKIEMWRLCETLKMERRKIIYVGGRGKPYEILKPRTDREGFHEYGERKSLKGISLIATSGKFELTMEDSTANEIGKYLRKQKKKNAEYLSEKRLESKTI